MELVGTKWNKNDWLALAGTERNDGINKKFPGPHTLNLRKVIFLAGSSALSFALAVAGLHPLAVDPDDGLTPNFVFDIVPVVRDNEADSGSQAVALLLLGNKTPFKLCKFPLSLHPGHRFPSCILRHAPGPPHSVTQFAPYHDRI